MAAFTTHVKTICENLAGYTESAGYGAIGEVLERAIPQIFDFEFPIYDEAYRNVLCTKILKHYYMREIGAETVGQWKFWLDVRLNEIMPYYNELYKSTLLDFNPLYDVDVTTTRTGSTDGTTNVTDKITDNDNKTTEKSGTAEGTHTSTEKTTNNGYDTSLNMFSDTPQGSVDAVFSYEGDAMGHMTDVRKIHNDNTNTLNGTTTATVNDTTTERTTDTANRVQDRTGKTVANTTEEYLEKVQGKNGGVSTSKLLMEYRKTFLNIDKMVIEELGDLFFNLW